MQFHADGTLPLDPAAVFVFGSNLAGRHGAGAAAVAAKRFGARRGCGEGLEGRSFAIPTKDRTLQTLPLDRIGESVFKFLAVARSMPETKFFVTKVGCGLAGYLDRDVAPLFRGAPDNCSFARDWQPFLERNA